MTAKNFASLPTVGGQAVVLTNDPRLAGLPHHDIQATLDFGVRHGPAEDSTTTTTIAAAWVTAQSFIMCSPSGLTTPDHDPDDYPAEQISAYATNLVPGVGFDIVAVAPNGTWGRYTINARG